MDMLIRTLELISLRKARAYAMSFCLSVCMFVCSSIANAFWWRRGLIASAVQAALTCCNKTRYLIRSSYAVYITLLVYHSLQACSMQVLRCLVCIYTSLFARKAAATSEKSTKHTTKTNKQKREKNYAQIGQASEQCYHQRTLKTSVNQR